MQSHYLVYRETSPRQDYYISGLENIDYLDLMSAVKGATKARAALIRVP
jgi:tRNA splicing endonuclease